jgi:hypothetical protein
LIELESFGDITVYEKVMVKKDSNGRNIGDPGRHKRGLRVFSVWLLDFDRRLSGLLGASGHGSGTMTGALLETNYYDFFG